MPPQPARPAHCHQRPGPANGVDMSCNRPNDFGRRGGANACPVKEFGHRPRLLEGKAASVVDDGGDGQLWHAKGPSDRGPDPDPGPAGSCGLWSDGGPRCPCGSSPYNYFWHAIFSTPWDMGVPHLVQPLPAENAAVVRTRLDPTHFYSVGSSAANPGSGGGVRDPEHDRHEMDVAFYQAPVGALVWTSLPPRDATPGPAGGTDIVAVCHTTAESGRRQNFVVLGVVASPIEDPGLVCRHPDELSFIATFVSGSHTILACKEDCEKLRPTNFIAIDWETPWQMLNADPEDTEATPFYVPRLKPVDRAARAFAMVLQSGRSELRILLLVERFGQSGGDGLSG